MKNICFAGLVIVTNTYTYLLTKLYINRNYLLISNEDIPKNENFVMTKVSNNKRYK